MEEHTHTATPTPEATPTAAPTNPPIVVQNAPEPAPTMSGRSFFLGFLTAVVLGAIGAIVFLVVSDSDDDGNLELDVPAVDVDIDG